MAPPGIRNAKKGGNLGNRKGPEQLLKTSLSPDEYDGFVDPPNDGEINLSWVHWANASRMLDEIIPDLTSNTTG